MKTRKLLALVLALLMVVSVLTLVSCGKEKEEPLNEYGDRIGEYDFGGDTVMIFGRGAGSMQIDAENVGEGDWNAKAIYDRQLEIADRFNVQLDRIDGGMGDLLAKYGEDFLSGDSNYDIGLGHMKFDVVAATNGYMLNLNKLKEIDLSMPYWNQAYTNMWAYKNLNYFTTGEITTNFIEQLVGCFVNLDTFKKYNPDVDLGQLIKDGKWTLEKMAELGGKYYEDIDEDGTKNNVDGYGYVVHSQWECSSFAYGGNFTLTAEEGGKHVFKIDTVENEAIFSKLYNLVNSDVFCYRGISSDLEANGNYMFAPSRLSRMGTVRDADWECAVIVMPKYDEASDYHTPTYDGIPCIGVEATLPTDRYAIVGVVMEAMASCGARVSTPLYFSKVVQSTYAQNQLTKENLETIRDTVWIDWGFAWCSCLNTEPAFEAIDLIVGDSLVAGAASAATIQAQYDSLFNGRITTLYNNLEKLYQQENATK